MERIAVVDDDPGVRRTVQRLLAAQGYEVVGLGTRAELRSRLAARALDLVVLDLDLGGDDGLAIAREVRTQQTIPILMLTGHDTVFDKVAGLEAGADDYLTKPFDGHELVARVRALLRRVRTRAEPVAEAWRFAGWRLHEAERALHASDGARVELGHRGLAGAEGKGPVPELLDLHQDVQESVRGFSLDLIALGPGLRVRFWVEPLYLEKDSHHPFLSS